ncbi:hypothetical protein EVAR_93890_1 [Eumeta japonica]|uniref:Ig-like domain-containing protein n=1 Tax=Eumeta variegata TaxID=151549 RepID=A0A4C1TWQ1_EUMVA|nr:hypothetical protein EVAR_93890_1 [Eumeta japonica]
MLTFELFSKRNIEARTQRHGSAPPSSAKQTKHSRAISLRKHFRSVASVTHEDAGNYTCSLNKPIQMRATARVHVLQGSSLAELQSGVRSRGVSDFLLILSLLATNIPRRRELIRVR